jgi:hypothetical protein
VSSTEYIYIYGNSSLRRVMAFVGFDPITCDLAARAIMTVCCMIPRARFAELLKVLPVYTVEDFEDCEPAEEASEHSSVQSSDDEVDHN